MQYNCAGGLHFSAFIWYSFIRKMRILALVWRRRRKQTAKTKISSHTFVVTVDRGLNLQGSYRGLHLGISPPHFKQVSESIVIADGNW